MFFFCVLPNLSHSPAKDISVASAVVDIRPDAYKMGDFSHSKIESDVIIFSNRDINAWNASIKSGSTIVLGGSHETLLDVLNHRADLASGLCGAVGRGNEASTADDFEMVTGDDAAELARVNSQPFPPPCVTLSALGGRF